MSTYSTKAREPKYQLLSPGVYQEWIHKAAEVTSVQVREEQSFGRVNLPVTTRLVLGEVPMKYLSTCSA